MESKRDFPSFIGDEKCRQDDSFESLLDRKLSSDEKYAIHARNLLKHIFRGTPLCASLGAHYSQSPLAYDEILDTLFSKRDACLLTALRVEMERLLINASKQLRKEEFRQKHEKQFEIFLSGFLASLPFMDPTHQETLLVPQKINGHWQLVDYRFERLDISPQSGPLSWIMEEEDHIYAFGLVSEDKGAPSHLICSGTPYPAGQGAGLAVLYNFYPRYSVGEAHEMKNVRDFLNRQNQHGKKVKVTGHSKGATMAMILAAQHRETIIQADCLNPAGLSGNTLESLSPKWNKYQDEKKPQINVYAQQGDPVFPLEKGFLKGTRLIKIIPSNDEPAMNCSASILGIPISIPKFLRRAYEAHIHHFAGRAGTELKEMDITQENNSIKREVFNDIKYWLNWPRFLLEYTELFFTILNRKFGRFYDRNRKTINAILIASALGFCALFACMGLLVPVVAPLIKASLGFDLSAISILAGCIGSSFLLPIALNITAKLSKLALKISNVVLNVGITIGVVVVAGLGSLLNIYLLRPIRNVLFPCCAPSNGKTSPSSTLSASQELGIGLHRDMHVSPVGVPATAPAVASNFTPSPPSLSAMVTVGASPPEVPASSAPSALSALTLG